MCNIQAALSRDANPRLRGGEHASILSPATASPGLANSNTRDPRAAHNLALGFDAFRARSGAHCADANSNNVELDSLRLQRTCSGSRVMGVLVRASEVIKARSRLMLRYTVRIRGLAATRPRGPTRVRTDRCAQAEDIGRPLQREAQAACQLGIALGHDGTRRRQRCTAGRSDRITAHGRLRRDGAPSTLSPGLTQWY